MAHLSRDVYQDPYPYCQLHLLDFRLCGYLDGQSPGFSEPMIDELVLLAELLLRGQFDTM